MNRIIMDELVYGVFKPEAVATFQRMMERMKNEGCDAVVLGCTEIPLIMNDANSPLPTLDSTRLLARVSLRRAVQARAVPGLVRRGGRIHGVSTRRGGDFNARVLYKHHVMAARQEKRRRMQVPLRKTQSLRQRSVSWPRCRRCGPRFQNHWKRQRRSPIRLSIVVQSTPG